MHDYHCPPTRVVAFHHHTRSNCQISLSLIFPKALQLKVERNITIERLLIYHPRVNTYININKYKSLIIIHIMNYHLFWIFLASVKLMKNMDRGECISSAFHQTFVTRFFNNIINLSLKYREFHQIFVVSFFDCTHNRK